VTSVGWDADPAVQPWIGFAALDGAVSADACVIGLGGSGLAAIDELTSRGFTVVGVDAGRVAAGAAGRNGGFLTGGAGMSVRAAANPGEQQLMVQLYQQMMAELDRLGSQLGPQVIRRAGSIRLAGLPGEPTDVAEAADAAREFAEFGPQLALCRSMGIQVERYDGELGQGLLFPDTAVMNPVRRAFGLAQRLAPLAQLFENSPVTEIKPGLVQTQYGSVSAPIIIVAVDGKLDRLLPQLAPLVHTVRLQMLATDPVTPGRLPGAVHCRWGYEYAQQDSAGRIFVGGGRDRFEDDERTFDDQPTAQVQAWIEKVAARMAGQPVTIAHRWAASVGYTADQRPLCIAVDDGVMACGGYSGSGNLVGPVAARTAVALAVDGATPPAYFRSSF
jgi:gamma-glutamylputrescine oxidase